MRYAFTRPTQSVGRRAAPVIEQMAEKEREHLAAFNEILPKRRVRPSLLQPLRHVAGFGLGAGSALLGLKAAMACTVAVEEVIDEHYAKQVALLGDDEKELRDPASATVRTRSSTARRRWRTARDKRCYRPLTEIVKAGSRAAIWLAERI